MSVRVWRTVVEHLGGGVDPCGLSAALGDAGDHALCGDGLALPRERLLVWLYRHVVARVLPHIKRVLYQRSKHVVWSSLSLQVGVVTSFTRGITLYCPHIACCRCSDQIHKQNCVF